MYESINHSWRMKYLKFFIVMFTYIGTQIIAQSTGKISGKVVDAEFGEGLVGVNIMIDRTTLGAAADYDGNYMINSVPTGEYSMTFSSIGYSKKIVTNVIVKADEVTKIDIVLSSEAFETDEVVVTATMLTNTEASLLAKRQKSISVSDAISAEQISRSGSGDAASAMRKVTGASVIGGKYVYVRGLGERYSATSLNGAELPSADPDKKSFQLDLFPSSLLDNINTVKTFTPDKPGTFTGGLVDVTMKTFPEKFEFQFSGSTSYNSQVTGNNDFFLPNGGGTDWFGFDDGTRSIPDILSNPDVQIPSYTSVRSKEEALQLDAMSKSFNNYMAPVSAIAPVDQGLSLAIGDNYMWGESGVGYIASFTWNQKYSFYNDGEVGRYNLTGMVEDVESLDPQRVFIDRKSSREVNWGAVASLSYKNNSIGQITASYIHTQSGESTARELEGYWKDLPSTATFQTRVLGWTERALNSYQLEGNHLFTWLNNSKLEWKTTYSSNIQDEPDLRYFSNHYSVRERNGVQEIIYQNPASLYPPPIRYFRNLEENNFTNSIDFTIPFSQWQGLSSKLKMGFTYSKVNRDYSQRRFEYQNDDFSYRNYGPDVNTYFSYVGIKDTSVSYFDFMNVIAEAKSLKNIFTGDQETFAGYMMIDLPILRDLRFIGGVRLETTEMNAVSADPDQPKGELNNTDLLPSINFIYQMSEKMNLRFAYSNTVARPTFRELAPYTNFEFVGDYLFQGNSNLKRTLVKNVDLRWEWFINPGEIIAVSAFYKDFIDPIEKYQNNSIPNGLLSVQNVSEAVLYGLEFEMRTGLVDLAEFLGNFSVGTNFSYVQSEVDIPKIELDVIRVADPNADSKRPFQGQSPYLFNLNISYDNYDDEINAGIFYNIFGDRLAIVTEGANPDVYERGYGSLDLKVSKGFAELYTLSFTAKNILDPEIEFTQELNGQEFTYHRFRRGVDLSLSLSVKL